MIDTNRKKDQTTPQLLQYGLELKNRFTLPSPQAGGFDGDTWYSPRSLDRDLNDKTRVLAEDDPFLSRFNEDDVER